MGGGGIELESVGGDNDNDNRYIHKKSQVLFFLFDHSIQHETPHIRLFGELAHTIWRLLAKMPDGRIHGCGLGD